MCIRDRDAIVDYMPAPTDVEDIKGVNPETEEQETRPSSDDAPFALSLIHISSTNNKAPLRKLCFPARCACCRRRAKKAPALSLIHI